MTSLNFSKSFNFELPTRIEFGAGLYKEIPRFLKDLKSRKVLIITDPGITSLPWFKEILSLLQEAGFDFKVFKEVEANPKDRDAEAGAGAATDFGADTLLALGGGSPIDCAKVVAILARQGGKPRDYEDRSKIGKDVLPILAVPTTAGTGTEVTFGAVITDTKNKFKFTVKSPRLAPKIALLDPVLTLSKSPALTAATGMDALTHAIEAFSSRAAEPLSDACALYAAELIAGNLERAVRHGTDLEARSAVLLGSLLAGIAFSHSDVGAVHCIAEALGGLYDIPHGVGNAVCLPAVMERCAGECAERYSRLAKAFGALSPDAPGAVDFVRQLAFKVGLPPFESFKVPEEDFPMIAEKSEANGSNKDNIPVLSKEDYLELLRTLQKGRRQ